MKAVGAKTTGAKLAIAKWAKGLGLYHQNQCQIGGSGYVPWGYSVANALVLSKVIALMKG